MLSNRTDRGVLSDVDGSSLRCVAETVLLQALLHMRAHLRIRMLQQLLNTRAQLSCAHLHLRESIRRSLFV